MKKVFLCLLLTSIMLLSSCAHKHYYGGVIESESDCSAGGYVYKICKICGYVEYIEATQAKSHDIKEYFDDIRYQTRYGYCAQCGTKVTDGEYQHPQGIDRLYIYGTPEGSVIPIEVTYVDGEQIYNAFGFISKDGNESNDYSKKDYDIQLFLDRERENPLSINPDLTLSSYDSFSLKSEYVDKSGVRNLTASAVWSAVVATRKNIDKNIVDLPNYGADAGFPILVYTNNNYKGAYNLCKPNDGSLFGLSDAESQALVYTYPFFGTFDFRISKNESEYIPCQIIFPTDKEAKKNVADNFSEFADFILHASDEEFVSQIEKYLDVEAAVDYLICAYAFGADKNFDLFCNWVTYDGQKWIPSMYNLIYTFGIDIKGDYVSPQDIVTPKFSENILISGTSNALWDKLCKNFPELIYERYTVLRSSLLTAENITSVFEGFAEKISDEVYKSEFLEYSEKDYLTGKYDSESIYKWLQERFLALDEVLLNK